MAEGGTSENSKNTLPIRGKVKQGIDSTFNFKWEIREACLFVLLNIRTPFQSLINTCYEPVNKVLLK